MRASGGLSNLIRSGGRPLQEAGTPGVPWRNQRLDWGFEEPPRMRGRHPEDMWGQGGCWASSAKNSRLGGKRSKELSGRN